MTFTEQAGKTTITMRAVPINATEAERKTFEGAFASLQQGSREPLTSLQNTWRRPKGDTMPTMIFVNLPVKDLSRSVEFFTKLGFTFNPQFTDETATCMIVSETIYVMLLTEAKFQTFTPKAICDAKQSTEVLVSLALESRQAVEDLVRKAFDAGGSNYAEPQDYGFMYQHGFEDLDGHLWELFYMDPSAVNQ